MTDATVTTTMTVNYLLYSVSPYGNNVELTYLQHMVLLNHPDKMLSTFKFKDFHHTTSGFTIKVISREDIYSKLYLIQTEGNYKILILHDTHKSGIHVITKILLLSSC